MTIKELESNIQKLELELKQEKLKLEIERVKRTKIEEVIIERRYPSGLTWTVGASNSSGVYQLNQSK